jgi:hypothetical protein
MYRSGEPMSVYDELPKFRYVELTHCQCGKVSYGSDAEAKAARLLVIGRDRAREEIRMKELVVYKCPLSGAFHLGRKLKPIPRQRKTPSSK